MSDTNEPKPRTTPQPVLNAQAALAQLRAQDAQLAARIATLLPGYAVRMDQRGEDTSVAALIAAAQRGPAALKEIFAQAAAPLTLHERYTKWIADNRPPSAPRPQRDYGDYNAVTDEFGMRAAFPPMGWYARDMYEMDRMAYEMDRHITPREARHQHAMMSRHADDMARHRNLQERAYQALREPNARKQLDMVRSFLEDAPARLALHFLGSLAKMNKFDLLTDLLHDLPGHFGDRYEMEHFSYSVLYPALSNLPKSEGFLLQLMRTQRWHDRRMASHLVMNIVSSRGMSAPALHALLDMPSLPLEDEQWLGVAMRLTKKEDLLHKAMSRLGPDCAQAIKGQHRYEAAKQFATTMPAQSLKDLFEHPVFTATAWDKLLLGYAPSMRADVIDLIAQKLEPGWARKIDLEQVSINFMSIDSARAFLACFPDDDLKEIFAELVVRASCKYNANEMTPAPLLQALSEHRYFAHVPVFKTLVREDIYSTQPRALTRLLNCMDLTQLSEEQRGEIMRVHKHDCHSAVPLVLSGPCPQDDKNKALQRVAARLAEGEEYAYPAYLLVKYGADPAVLNDVQRALLAEQRSAYDNWQRVTRTLPPRGLPSYDPAPFKAPLLASVVDIMKTEEYSGAAANIFAYRAAALLQSEERILQYLQKWGDAKSRQPLHNLLQKAELPKGDLSGVNLNDWGDAILRHGPEMAKLVKFCKSIPSPARSDDGTSWSLAKTREIAAQYVYARGGEHSELAALCHKHSVSEANFNAALDIVARTPAHEKNLPALSIAGKDFGLPNARFRLLDSGDIRGLFMGELTDCCQSIGGAGAKCATHGFTSPNGGFYVVETDKGEIIGQTWAWRGEKGELVFDSLEMLKGRVSPQQWQDLVTQVVRQIGARKAQHGITAFMIGTSGETPSSFGKLYPRAAAQQPIHGYAMYATAVPAQKPEQQREPAQPCDYSGYRDSKAQYIIWQKGAKKAPEKAAKPK